MAQPLRVVILKPSKYGADDYVERFRWGFMPNSTVAYVRSMTPAAVNGTPIAVHPIDEYVHRDLRYLSLLRRPRGGQTLVALVGVQSHQLHRALDLAAYARRNGCLAVIGGPHVMTCDTSPLHGRGVSFAQAEAELLWPEILEDAADGNLRPVYGQEQRWQQELAAPALGPTLASFYILCPIPGIEQYDDFLAQGLINENNLDRFDGTSLTWRHPCLTRVQLAGLLFRCYRRFYSWGQMLRNAVHRTFCSRSGLAESAKNLGLALFSRYCAWRQMHPMSGVRRLRRDVVNDFMALRQQTFGLELAPLPQSLQLSAAESRLNGVTKPRGRARLPQNADPLQAGQSQTPVNSIPATVDR